MKGPERVLLVGESNPFGGGTVFDLWPEPRGSSGGRFAGLLGMERGEYLRTFDRVNLLRGRRWSPSLARESASRLEHRRRILLGARVAAAHAVPFRPLFSNYTTHEEFCLGWRAAAAMYGGQAASCAPGARCVRLLVLPHPSGRSREWNDVRVRSEAREAVKRFLAEGAGV